MPSREPNHPRVLGAVLVTLVLIVVSLLAGGCGAPEVEWELTVGGAVDTPLSLSFADLAKMPQTDLNDIQTLRPRGGDAIESWSGVALTEIFEQAGADALTGITAVGADGYMVEISADDLQDGIVALKQNGEWITKADPEHGPIRLVAPNTPTNRWVFQLAEIQVNDAVSAADWIGPFFSQDRLSMLFRT